MKRFLILLIGVFLTSGLFAESKKKRSPAGYEICGQIVKISRTVNNTGRTVIQLRDDAGSQVIAYPTKDDTTTVSLAQTAFIAKSAVCLVFDNMSDSTKPRAILGISIWRTDLPIE